MYDASGIDRVPFDGRHEPRRDTRYRGPRYANHGPQCSPNPEIGCVCGADEIDERGNLR